MLDMLVRASDNITRGYEQDCTRQHFTRRLCDLILIGTNIYEEVCISRLVYVNCTGQEFYKFSEQTIVDFV